MINLIPKKAKIIIKILQTFLTGSTNFNYHQTNINNISPENQSSKLHLNLNINYYYKEREKGERERERVWRGER